MNLKPGRVGREFQMAPPNRVASRLNSFCQNGLSVADAIRRLAANPQITALELNYPRHLTQLSEGELDRLLSETGLPLTALNVRLEGAEFQHGGFTAPNAHVREKAVQIAVDAVDAAARYGAGHVVLWLAEDGWDYPFEVNYVALWSHELAGFRAVAQRNPTIRVSVEYKPFDPRRFSLIRSMGDALLAAQQVGLANFGVTLDVCHSYMAGEHPAAAAAAALRAGKLFGVHLNDGYGRADDGLMLGSIHPNDALELLWVLQSANYQGTFYFDTFPTRIDPAAELAVNIARLEELLATVERLDGAWLRTAQHAHDGFTITQLPFGPSQS